jgi:NADP-dependent 3-hydroxy acid dehydrogenase YdfG
MTTSNELQGTVSLVTGASSGIGEATAIALAEQESAVAIVARRRDRLEQLAGRIQCRGGRARLIEANVSSEDQASGPVERTVSELGRLDTLINNIGGMLLGPVQDAPLEEWEQMLKVDVAGLLYCAHAALPHLLRAAEEGPRQVADMVNISSVAGRIALRALLPQSAGDPRADRPAVRQRRAAGGGGHRPGDHLHCLPPAPRCDQ